MTRKPLGLQLWTVRKEFANDLAGTLRRVAEIGYHGVELHPSDWPDVKELKAILDDVGLQMFSAHVPFLRLRDEFNAVADYCHTLSAGDLVVPSLPGPLYKDEGKLRAAVAEIAGIAQSCKKAGFRCSYHNHATEFENRIAGQEVHDFIFETVGADLLNAQLDTYFIEAVGKNPAQYIRRYAGRVPLLHLKDKSKKPNVQNTEVGHGTIDWDAVLAASDEAGVEWRIVEQNCTDCPALESIQISYEFLKSKGAV